MIGRLLLFLMVLGRLAAPQTFVAGREQTRGLVFVFDGGGSALTAGKVVYLRAPFACTLKTWSVQAGTAETVTLKTWLVSGGTALPTASNSISTAGVSLSTGTFVYSADLSDFSAVAVAKDAQIAATITAVTASTQVTFTLGCQQ